MRVSGGAAKREWRVIALISLVLTLAGFAGAAAAPGKAEPEPDADGLMVAFREQSPQATRLSLLDRLGLELSEKPALRFFARLRLGAKARQQGRSIRSALAQLKADPNVRVAEPDFRLHTTAIPNDPNLPQLWGLRNTGQSGGTVGADIHAAEAWDITTGDGNLVVAVIDTGVDYTHPDLAANILRDGQGKVVGYDFAHNDADPMDDNGHGTHVSGTIGAVGNNDKGVVGVNWRVKIMPLKFLNSSGNGDSSDAIAAIDWATQHGARIMSNSWGGGGYSQLMAEAINRARNAGILFVAAAGNDGSSNDNVPTYPASYNQVFDNVISVGASTDHDGIAGFSNWGARTVDIAAPGENIFSTWKGGTYQLDSGTSMATPHVSGAAALLLAKYPKLTYLQIKTRLLANVDHPIQVKGFVRTGRLNVAAALVQDDTPPGSPSGFTAVQASSDAMLLNWTASGDDGPAGTASQYELRFSTGPINEGNLQFAGLAPELPQPAPSGDQQSYLLPGLAAGIPYYLALRSMDKVGNYSPLVTLGPITTAPPGSPLIQVSDNVEGAPLFSGWSATGEAFASPSHSYTDSPGGSYLPNTDSSLTLNSSILLVGFAPRLQFKAKYDLENGYDFVYVEVSPNQGQTWIRTPLSLTGTTSNFVAQTVSLAPYYGQSVLVRFRLLTDSIGQQNGAWIDDIQILGNQLFNLNGPQVPLAPSGMTAAATSQTSVHVTWTDNSSDETNFRVERRVGLSGGNWVVVGSPPANTAQMDDATANAGTTYTYRMFAVNAEGDSPAAAVQVTTPPFPPAVPASPEATAGPGSITLLWEGSPGAGSYTVRRSLTPGGPHTVLKTGVSLAGYVDTAVTFGTTYYYTVSAVNSGGESNESDEVSGSPLPAPPAPPTNVKAKRPTAKKSVVTWTQSAGPDVAKNRIYRATAQAGPWTLVAEINPGKTYTNTGLAKKTAYYYQVTAVSGLGAESTRSNTAFVKKK